MKGGLLGIAVHITFALPGLVPGAGQRDRIRQVTGEPLLFFTYIFCINFKTSYPR
jgi:hypothetical protein